TSTADGSNFFSSVWRKIHDDHCGCYGDNWSLDDGSETWASRSPISASQIHGEFTNFSVSGNLLGDHVKFFPLVWCPYEVPLARSKLHLGCRANCIRVWKRKMRM